jgi:hypothetical protein
MTKLEEVARALYAVAGQTGDWDSETEGKRAFYRHCARAAIEAMREPTPYMVMHGYTKQTRDPRTVEKQWEAMIDAALEE